MRRDSTVKNRIATLLGVFLSIGVAFILAIGLIFVLSEDPKTTLFCYFLGPFMDRFTFFNMIAASIPLIFSGLGMAIAFQSGVVNLGGEGQIFSGAMICLIVGTALPSLPKFIGIPLILLSSILFCGFLAGISGYLRKRWNVSDLLSTYLISMGIVSVINFLILGPLRDTNKITIQSISLPSSYLLKRIMLPSYLNTGIILALLVAVGLHFFMYRTHRGYELRVTGSNRDFARYAGIHVGKYYLIPMFLSGGVIGLGGAIEVVGRYQAVFSNLTAGLGWNGIAVALIARNNPIAVVPAALFYAYLSAGAKYAMIHSDLTSEFASIISAIIFYLVTAEAAYSFIRRRIGK